MAKLAKDSAVGLTKLGSKIKNKLGDLETPQPHQGARTNSHADGPTATKQHGDSKASAHVDDHHNLNYNEATGTFKSEYWTKEIEFNGNRVYQRNDLIDPYRIDTKEGLSNLELMKNGRAPKGVDGKPINLHHLIQRNEGGIAEMTQTFHQKYRKIMHIDDNTIPSKIDRSKFDTWRAQY